MTDRLAELTGGLSYGDDLPESGDAAVATASNDTAAQEAIDLWTAETEELGRDIGGIEKATFDVKQLFRQSLNAEDGDTTDRDRAEEVCESTVNLSQTIRTRLRALGDQNRQFKADYPGRTGELRLRVTQHQALARRFMTAMEDWEGANDAHREESKRALEAKFRVLRPDATEEEISRAVRDGDESFLTQVTAGDVSRAQAAVEDLRSRTRDIKRLEESIVALHQLFVDMQIMVEAQGELLNNVEYEIGETRNQAQNAHAELVQARAHQKSARKKKCCIFFLVICIVLVVTIGLIIRFAPEWVRAAKDKISTVIPIPGGNSTEPPPPPPLPPSNGTQNGGNTTMRDVALRPVNLTQLLEQYRLLS